VQQIYTKFSYRSTKQREMVLVFTGYDVYLILLWILAHTCTTWNQQIYEANIEVGIFNIMGRLAQFIRIMRLDIFPTIATFSKSVRIIDSYWRLILI